MFHWKMFRMFLWLNVLLVTMASSTFRMFQWYKKTKDVLVAEDPRSEELLKPILRGRDIKRYRAEWAGLWVIDSHNGYGNVPPVNVDDYIAIKQHLDQFYPHLKKRQDKGVTPYNLRHCAYDQEFLRDKLVLSTIKAAL